MKWCGLATSLRMSALGLNCGKRRTYSEPARLRDQLSEGRDRKILTDLNQKTKTRNHCVLETKLRLEQGRPRHFGKITICPTKIAISSTIRSTTPRCSKKSGRRRRCAGQLGLRRAPS